MVFFENPFMPYVLTFSVGFIFYRLADLDLKNRNLRAKLYSRENEIRRLKKSLEEKRNI